MDRYLWAIGIVAGLFVYCVILGRMLAGPDDEDRWLENGGQWEDEEQ